MIIGRLFLKAVTFAFEIILPSFVINLLPNFVCQIATGFFSMICIFIELGSVRSILTVSIHSCHKKLLSDFK